MQLINKQVHGIYILRFKLLEVCTKFNSIVVVAAIYLVLMLSY